MTQFKRIFHPVGQGAFYTESHIGTTFHVSQFNIAYDCGSTSLDPDKLKKCVNGGLRTNDLDILFVSHFDEDHINGIKFLNPKTIVIPLLTDREKLIFMLQDILYGTGFVLDFEVMLQRQFPNAKIIKVQKQYDSENTPQETQDIDQIVAGSLIPSGSRISSQFIPKWVYIPFNPNVDTSLLDEFDKILKNAKPPLDIDRIYKLDAGYIESNLDPIKKAYKGVFGKYNLNEYSMLLYSGPLKNNFRFLSCYSRCSCAFDCRCMDYWIDERYPACIYTGDANLHRESKRSKFKSGSEILRYVYSSLSQDMIDAVGTIQVPHHGSQHNYTSLLKSYLDSSGQFKEYDRPILYVISVGRCNKFGHPSWWVVSDLLDFPYPHRCRNVILVSDDFTSGVIERGEY